MRYDTERDTAGDSRYYPGKRDTETDGSGIYIGLDHTGTALSYHGTLNGTYPGSNPGTVSDRF